MFGHATRCKIPFSAKIRDFSLLLIKNDPHKNRPISRLKSFLQKPFHDKLNVVESILCTLKGRLYYRHVFGSFGRGSKLYKPLFLSNPRFMHIGENVHIRPGARLEAILIDPNSPWAFFPAILRPRADNDRRNTQSCCNMSRARIVPYKYNTRLA